MGDGLCPPPPLWDKRIIIKRVQVANVEVLLPSAKHIICNIRYIVKLSFSQCNLMFASGNFADSSAGVEEADPNHAKQLFRAL